MDEIWEVFARKAREDPLKHVGSIRATDGVLAGVYAWKIYDEERWFEMVVAPRSAFVAVNRSEAAFTLNPSDAGVPGEWAGARAASPDAKPKAERKRSRRSRR